MGEGFNVVVNYRDGNTTNSFTGVLTPVKLARGAVVSDMTTRPVIIGSSKRSWRDVAMPWGHFLLPALQNVKQNHVQFVVGNGEGSGPVRGGSLVDRGRGPAVNLNVNGDVIGGKFFVRRTQVNLGYGSIDSTSATLVFPYQPPVITKK